MQNNQGKLLSLSQHGEKVCIMRTKYLIAVSKTYGEDDLFMFHNVDDAKNYFVENGYVVNLDEFGGKITKDGFKYSVSVKKVQMCE